MQMNLPDMLEFITIGFKADRFKTFMSSLGIIIGVLSIVVMLSVGQGLYSGVFSEFKDFNLDIVEVSPGRDSDQDDPFAIRATEEPAKLTDKDVDALNGIVGVKKAAPGTEAMAIISFRSKNSSANLMGISPEKEPELMGRVAVGRFLQDSDYKAAVIGQGVAEDLFRMKISPGNKIRLYVNERYMDFKVVGILDKKNKISLANFDPNMDMYITHKAMKELQEDKNYYYDRIEVTVEDPSQAEAVAKRIQTDLKRYHKDEAFSAVTFRSMLASLENILYMVQVVLGGISAISLIVGGIGISNVMMLTVKERIREIGVMKSLGATTGIIRRQYLLEAALLGVVSSLIGIILGSLISLSIASLASLPSALTLQAIAIGFLFGALTTTIAGAYPASRAARLDPIEALRAE